MEENQSPVQSDDNQVLLQDSQLPNNVAGEMSDISETIITSLSHTENNLISSQGSIIITNDGMVFPSGNLMIPNEGQEENTSVKNNLNEEILDNKNNEHGDSNEFDIKVESNALQAVNYTSTSKANQTFSIDQSVLQSITDADTDLQQITFNDGDHIAQFQIQLPLSITDVQNLRNINKNVFFSQAALPDDNKGLEHENIVCSNSKQTFLIQTTPLDNTNSKTDISQEGSNKYLTNFSTEDTSVSFIKPECNNSSLDRSTIKSETLLATVNSTSQCESNVNPYSQILYVQVDGGSQQLVPISVTPATVSTLKRPAEKEIEVAKDGTKTKRRKTPRLPTLLPKDSPKDLDKLRSLAPRLLSYPLYAGAQASIGAGKSLLKPYDITTLNIVEGGQYFEVLGRCTQCFRFSRTTSYCRAEKNHRDPKSSVCLECEFNGLSTVVCRRKMNHSAPNAQPLNIVINTALQNAEHVKQLCIRNMLPPCFAELHSIVVHHADITFVGQRPKDVLANPEDAIPHTPRKSTDYARGYLYPYSKEKWEEWLGKFCRQTGTTFRIRTGKRVNKKSDHGLANHNGKIISYRTLETQLYNCSLGGKPRKRKPKDGTKKRKERGSRLMGCPGVIHTRLLETELEWRSLEITIPKVSAHLSCHDPRLVPGNIFAYDDDILFNDMHHVHLQDNNQELSDIQDACQQQTAHDISIGTRQTHDTSLNQHGNDGQQTNNLIDAQKLNVNLTELKNSAKTILLTCVSLLDSLNSVESMHCLETSAQDLLSYIVNEAHKQQTCTTDLKEMKDDSNVVMDIEVTSPPQLETIVE